MTGIKSISILGAGAMGAAYGDMFSQAGGFSVSFVASGDRYNRLSQNRLTVNGHSLGVPARRPDPADGPADLVLVALKHHHLPHALDDIEPLVGERTVILSVMNGLESEEIIGARYGMDKMVHAVAVGIDAVRDGDRFTYANPGKIIFGAAPSAGGDTARVDRLKQALDQAGIPNEVSGDIMRAMWWKFMINVGVNQASAALRAPYGVFQSSPDARALMRALMAEVIALAPTAGVALDHGDIDQWNEILLTLSPTGKTSMLQDLEAGRKTEVEIFAGKVVSQGKRHGVPTPVNETVLRIIKVLESGQGV